MITLDFTFDKLNEEVNISLNTDEVFTFDLLFSEEEFYFTIDR